MLRIILANLHAYFLVGPFVSPVFCVLVERLYRRGRRYFGPKQLAITAVMGVLCWPACIPVLLLVVLRVDPGIEEWHR
jgi:hypothetical protein